MSIPMYLTFEIDAHDWTRTINLTYDQQLEFTQDNPSLNLTLVNSQDEFNQTWSINYVQYVVGFSSLGKQNDKLLFRVTIW